MMNQLKKTSYCISIHSLINTVILMLFFSCLNANPVLAQATEGKPLTDNEQLVEKQIRAGKDVNFTNKEEISADFLANLLKQYSSQDSKSSKNISISCATISGNLKLEEITIPYHLSLEDCIFNNKVDFSYIVFQKGLSLTRLYPF